MKASDSVPQYQSVKIIGADPTAIGLFGLALVTLVASSQKMGLTTDIALVIPWALFLGALAQLYASICDAKLGNTFGATAFGAYGFFWLGIALTWIIQSGVLGETLQAKSDYHQLGVAFLGYLIFSLFMTYGAASIHKVLFFIFVAIDVLFIGLMLDAMLDINFGHYIAASAEISISLLAFYGCGASILNSHFGRTVLPVGKPFIKR
jgi:hypothetical protein